jgi:NhaP-type Na+/H+ or K+/H+ antiporter
MSLNFDRSLEYLKMLIIVGILILIGQRFGYGIAIIPALPGMVIVILISFLALTIKDSFPDLKFPAFAWASLTALILSMPFMPTADLFLKYTNEVNFLGTTTPILAFAGISVGNKIEKLKKLSWKVFIVAIAVFIGTYFGSAIVAHIVLKVQGII